MERLCEIYRYMGIKNSEKISEQIKNRVTELLCLAKELSDFKYVYKKLQIKNITETTVDLELLKIDSQNLIKNLKDCSEVIIFVATLGMEFEKKLRFFSASEPSDALIFQAIGTELLEAYCDNLTQDVFLKDYPEHFGTKPRFSPGYGDLSLECQKDIFRILKPEKTIGAYLTDSLMMVPSKTITAIVGITDTPKEKENSCKTCKKTDCEFRKD